MTPTDHEIKKFKDRVTLAGNLAEITAQHLRTAIAKEDRASLIVSGGSTPKPFFQALSNQNLDWDKVTITLADERWVEAGHEDSNELLVRQYLIQNKARAAQLLGFDRAVSDVEKSAYAHEKELSKIPRPFDAVILGMGDDGHTASLFPGSKQLQTGLALKSDRLCIHTTPPNAAHERISLTLPTLLDTKLLVIHITGDKKLTILEKALMGNTVDTMPIRGVLQQNKTPVTIFWAP